MLFGQCIVTGHWSVWDSTIPNVWVRIAAGLGHAQTVVWLLAFGTLYLPMGAAVYHLNHGMPLESGLYVWTRRAFGDTAGLLVVWNIWGYALSTIATILRFGC
jgi:amino acid transporter